MPASKFGPLAWTCIALMLAAGCAMAQPPSGTGFDQTYRTLFGPDSYDRSPAYYQQLVAKLRDELPPDDPARALRLFAAECTDQPWW